MVSFASRLQLEGWLVMNVGSKEAEEVLAIVQDLIAVEREACARICEKKAKDYLSHQYAMPQPAGSINERFACKQIAEAIRARGT